MFEITPKDIFNCCRKFLPREKQVAMAKIIAKGDAAVEALHAAMNIRIHGLPMTGEELAEWTYNCVMDASDMMDGKPVGFR